MKDQRQTGNHVGVPQPQCNGCGNCFGGCNTGAKTTVNMSYLPDAKYHGAEIFTMVGGHITWSQLQSCLPSLVCRVYKNPLIGGIL